jgi:DNA-binding IclR family transcriptional regulator
MGKRYEVKKIKSAQRVLEVLEYFTPDRREATVMDVARAMGYPQSSTSELLTCLVSLGYLHCDRRARVYRPSARVALLGAWVHPDLFRSGHLLSEMDSLADQTGLAVVLTAKVGIWAQNVHVVCRQPDTATPRQGQREILTRSPAGKLLLSTLERELAGRLIHRINAEVDLELRVSRDVLLAELRDLGGRRIAGGNKEGQGEIAMLLPQAGDEPLTVGLHGAVDDLMRNMSRYVQVLKNTFDRKPEWTEAQAQPRPVDDSWRSLAA